MTADQYKYLFGPVPSRRLGMSLGVDLVPYKTCSMDCVYCESGATTCLTTERREYVPTSEVMVELDSFLEDAPELDYITFSGAGEPTLHCGIGQVISHVHQHHPGYKMCLLTNASLLNDAKVRAEVTGVDLIVPSLDAGRQQELEAVNRPPAEVTIESIVAGLVSFRQESKALFWLEIFIVPGVNDSEESLLAIVDATRKIEPDKIQLNQLDRPGTESWVEAAPLATAQRFADALAGIAPVEIVGRFVKRTTEPARELTGDALQKRILELVTRRPCTSEDISASLSILTDAAEKVLTDLVRTGQVVQEERDRGTFYRIAQ